MKLIGDLLPQLAGYKLAPDRRSILYSSEIITCCYILNMNCTPTDLCICMLGLWVVVMFEKVLEPLGGGNLVEKAAH